ncbi:MAG: methyl-accepting chemotaxis protein, partial [Proteobacteria bacterium]
MSAQSPFCMANFGRARASYAESLNLGAFLAERVGRRQTLQHRRGLEIKPWEKIAFRVTGAFLLPLALTVLALYSVSARHAELGATKDSLGRLWSGLHAGESRALLQLAKLRIHAEAIAADPQPSLFPQVKSGLQEMRYELEQLEKIRARIAAASGQAEDAELRELSQRLSEGQRSLSVPVDKLLENARRQNPAETQAARKELERLSLDAEAGLGRLRARHELFEQRSLGALAAGDAALADQIYLFLALIVIAGAVGASFLVFTLVRPLRAIAERVREIASGDGLLSERVPAAGAGEVAELVSSVNALLEKRQSMIGAVGHASEVVGSTT